jgi:transcriptional regulator with XRE-family HTH domain
MEKGLSQKECAQKISQKHSVLQDYESGKAIPNPRILENLEKVLGVGLRGTSASPCLYHITHAGGQGLMLERSWRDRGTEKVVVQYELRRSSEWIEMAAIIKARYRRCWHVYRIGSSK